MKILGISCSPRKGQTTTQALEACLQAAAEQGAQTQLLELGGLKVNGCLACGHCADKLECSQDDDFPGLIPLLTGPELAGLIVGTPVYFGGMSSQAKALLDRMVMLRRNGFMLRDKVGGVLAVGGFRNGGQELAIGAIQAAMLTQDMVIVGDGQPSAHFGGTLVSGQPGGVAADEFGLSTARGLGQRVAEVAARLHG